MAFTEVKLDALTDLRSNLPTIREWPPENPLSFVLMLAPRTKGKLGEALLERLGLAAGATVGPAESVAYDKTVGGQRYEVKFSTEDPPRFQQVRDPRLDDGNLKYDFLVGISARPDGLVYWRIPAVAVGALMDDGVITVQHAMSDTKWFTPSRTEDDSCSVFRLSCEELVKALGESS